VNNFVLKITLFALLLGWGTRVQAQDERMFYVFDASNGMADNSAQTIKCTKTGRMVITTIGHVNFYDGNVFTHIDPIEEDVFPLPKYRGHYHLMFDKHHHLWLKDKYQVTCVDLLTETFHHNVKKVFDELKFNKPVHDLFIDVGNRLWILSGQKVWGVDVNASFEVKKGVELHDIDVFDNRLFLLFYNDGSVSAFDLKSGAHMFEIQGDTEEEADKYSRTSVIYPYGEGYYQIRNGSQEFAKLRYLDMESHRWTDILDVPYHLNSVDVFEGKLYIACAQGYWTYDLQTKEKVQVKELMLSKGRTLQTDINTLTFDRQGGMWVGTEKRGLLYAKAIASPFKTYSWSKPESMSYYNLMEKHLDPSAWKTHNRPVICVYRDSRGWTWTGMYTGLKLVKTTGGTERVFGHQDGLMNEMVHSVIEDDNHDIWVATSYGISHLFIKEDSVSRIETYINQDNVPRESFVNGMAAKLDDGTIVMQSQDCMVVFNPKDFNSIVERDLILYPKLVRLTVNGQLVEPNIPIDGHVVIDKAITRMREINVNYDQNSLKLTFSAMNYLRPVQTYYRFRIKGVKNFEEWRVVSHGNAREMVDKNGMLNLQLLSITPGRYEIELQSSLTPDNWKHEPYVWVLMVNQPWWRTTLLYILLAISVVALLVANFIQYNRNTRLKLIRGNEETDILRRVKSFANRCNMPSGEVLTPYTVSQQDGGENTRMSDEFIEVMMKVIPFINSLGEDETFDVSTLAEKSGIPTSKLYGLLAAHLDKNPRPLIGRLRLQEAAHLLRNSQMEIEEIANKCRFGSPNYFIATFYHHYRMTPQDYRNSTAL